MKTSHQFEHEYKKLNTSQKQAVDTIDGPVFVMAGPGTGKTQILTLRIANILKESAGIQPENILALTFTNTASYNMRERLSGMIGPELAHRIHISTFHSFAEEMIQKHVEYFPRFFGARLSSSVESIGLIEDILESYPSHYFSIFKRRPNTLPDIERSIASIKNEGLTPDEFRVVSQNKFDALLQDEDLFYKRAYQGFQKGDIKPAELKKREKNRDMWMELADIYERYDAMQQEKGLYDFSDLIVFFIQAMKHEPDFKAEMQELFHYILVDEHQDTNDAQNAIIHQLIDNPVHEGKPNIFVVGDDKQAIYRFAGASVSSFQTLKNMLAEMVVIDLSHNYRSGQHVLDEAHALITKSSHHTDASELTAYFDEHRGVIEYRSFSRDLYEIAWIVDEIIRRKEQGESYEEMAILTRNNKSLHGLMHTLRLRGIPVQDHTKKNILDHPDMLKLFLLFRVVSDVDDSVQLARLLYVDFLNIPVMTATALLRRWKNTKHKEEKSLYTMMQDKDTLRDVISDTTIRERVESLLQFLDTAHTRTHNDTFQDFFVWCIRESGFLKYILAQSDSAVRLARLERLYDEIKKESATRMQFSFSDFMHLLNSFRTYGITLDMVNKIRVGVNAMTYHAAKGLEFDTVFLYKTLEHKKHGGGISLPFDVFDHGSIDDERRLMYVGLTRARKNIYITSAQYDEQGKERMHAQFIDELPNIVTVDTKDFETSKTQAFVDMFAESKEPLTSLANTEYLIDRFMERPLSVSALNNYKDDPLKYFFKNLLMLPDALSPHLDFGNLVHGSLELYFEACKNKNKILGWDALKQSLDTMSKNNYRYPQYMDRAEKFLQAYFDEHHKNFDVPLENEFHVKAVPFAIDEEHEIRLTGKIDKITKDSDGNIIVWDYKTGKTYSGQTKDRKEKLVRQAAFYKLLLMYYHDGKYSPSKVIFDFIEPAEETGKYEDYVVDITAEHVDQICQDIKELARAIFDGTLLQHVPQKNEENKEYIELLEMILGNVSQGNLFNDVF
ncbi:MAG: ATP-dependent helicase [Candidatus Pacebacteria bacterium]|nr:ATP-dependent helicase [Candidatus Paceibacterota bacterium]